MTEIQASESETSFKRKRESIYYYDSVALPLNADDDHKCIPSLIEFMADEFFAALYFHSKVFALRIDLHSGIEHTDSEPVKDLLRWLKQDLRRYYRMNNIGHFWVNEYGKKKGNHWHLLLLLDGNKIQSSWAINEKIKAYWENTRRFGEVAILRNCYTQILREDNASFEDAFYRSSYLCKERSKFVGTKRCFGKSRLSHKMKKLTQN